MQQTRMEHVNTTIGKVDCYTNGTLTVNLPSKPSIHIRQCEKGRRQNVLYAHESKAGTNYGTVSYESTATLKKVIDVEDYDKVIKYLRMQTCALDTMLDNAFTNGIDIETNNFERGKKYMYRLEPHSYGIFCDRSGYKSFQTTVVGFYGSESIFDTWTTWLSDISIQSVEISEEEYNRFNNFIFDMVKEANNLILKYARF